MVLALLDLWPSFQWQRVVLDPPSWWLDNFTEEKCDRPQIEVLRKVEHPVSPGKRSKVYFPEPPQQDGLITPTPPARGVPPVPLRLANSGLRLTRIA